MKPSVAVITGASSGIGFRTAQCFCERGFTVYGICRTPPADGRIVHIPTDVSNETAVREAFARIHAETGRIDILINNAGFGISGAVEFTDNTDVQKLFDVNFFGVLSCCKAVIPYMRAAGSGRILNISSVAGPLAIPFQAFYSASKAAVSALSMALASEVRPFGIEVCTVMPGDIKTGFTAARRKSTVGTEIYGAVLERSVAAMEHDEENGMTAEYAAARLYRYATARRMKPLRTIGSKYKLFYFISKVLPASAVVKIIAMMYAR